MSSVHLLATIGNGPEECRLALAGVLHKLRDEAEAMGLDLDVAEITGKRGPSAASIIVHGPGAEGFTTRWVGTIQHRQQSPLRPKLKRKNWFVGIYRLPGPKAGGVLEPTQVRYDTFRAGGPGGQHQNTTDSAVRATWRGYSVVARDQRSQHRNKAAALERLRALVALETEVQAAQSSRDAHQLHQQLERGNPVRTFKGARFLPG